MDFFLTYWPGILAAIAGVAWFALYYVKTIRYHPPDYPRCAKCYFDLTGHIGEGGEATGNCPECGNSLHGSSAIPAGEITGKELDRVSRRYRFLGVFVYGFGAIGSMRIGETVLAIVCAIFAVGSLYAWITRTQHSQEGRH
jgi:hypothetical protein